MSGQTLPDTQDHTLNFEDIFHEKQHEANRVADAHTFTLFGGTRGPGKSYWLRWHELRFLILKAQQGFKNVRVGLFCENYPALKDRQMSRIAVEFPAWLGELKESTTLGLGFHLFPEYGGGSILLRNLDDPSKFQSVELAMVGVDELTRNKVDVFSMLRGSMRWPGIEDVKFVSASNPGGPGHLWVKSYFIDHVYPEELEKFSPQFAYVPALPDDNANLPASYWEMLNSLPPALAKAWRWGNWDVFEGMAFENWDRPRHVCQPFEIPMWWPRWRAIDWGSYAPFCCLWFAKDPDIGRVYVYRELYVKGLTDRQQARLVIENTLPGESITTTYADPSMWTKKSHEDRVYSTYDEYAAEGIPLTKADNHRMTGKRKLDTLLANLPDGKPGIVFFDNCKNLVRTLPSLPRSSSNPEDVDTDAEDHAYDTVRYGITQVRLRVNPAQSSAQSNIEFIKDHAFRRTSGEFQLRGRDF
jgi:hypothetical protein